MALVGDAAGYVTKSSGEGIYFGQEQPDVRRAIVEISKNGSVIPTEKQIKSSYLVWDRKYSDLRRSRHSSAHFLQKRRRSRGLR